MKISSTTFCSMTNGKWSRWRPFCTLYYYYFVSFYRTGASALVKCAGLASFCQMFFKPHWLKLVQQKEVFASFSHIRSSCVDV